MPFTRKQQAPDLAPPRDPRFARFRDDELVDTIEAALGRSSEVFRGFSHAEVDRGWVVSELETQLATAYSAVCALRDRLHPGSVK